MPTCSASGCNQYGRHAEVSRIFIEDVHFQSRMLGRILNPRLCHCSNRNPRLVRNVLMPHSLLPKTTRSGSDNAPTDTAMPARQIFSLRVLGHPAFPRCRDAADDDGKARDAPGILHAQMIRLPLVVLIDFHTFAFECTHTPMPPPANKAPKPVA